MRGASHSTTVTYKFVLTGINVSLLFDGALDSCHSDVLPVEGTVALGVCDTALVLKNFTIQISKEVFLVV